MNDDYGYRNFENPQGQYTPPPQPPRPPRKKSNAGKYVALVLVSVILSSAVTGGGMYLYLTGQLGISPPASAASAKPATESLSTANTSASAPKASTVSTLGAAMSATEVAKKVGPSIVGIRMTVGSPQSFFGQQQSEQQAEGSGIIISSDGYIMTNYHVVQYADTKSGYGDSTTLEVFLPDGREAKAKFIGGDSTNDLAVLKIDLTGLSAVTLGDSSTLQVGEDVVAIGNPLGMEFAGSVTTGVVSALNREVETEISSMNLIQTDAAINPGNSGGALVNMQGQVIGINSSKISATGVEGLGFAIPINDAKPIVEALKQYGYVKGRPLIGISGQEITEALSQQYGLPMGIYITSVTQGSGASQAGITKGDVLTSLDGKDVKSMSDVDTIKKSHKAGDTVKAVIYRDGSKTDINITFSEDK
jgi:serine protease Do